MDNNAQLIAEHRKILTLVLFILSWPCFVAVCLLAESHWIPTAALGVIMAGIIYREENNFSLITSSPENGGTRWRFPHPLEKEDLQLAKKMRAKMVVDVVRPSVDGGTEHVGFRAVAKDDGYGDDGKDENNTFALFTPSARATIEINNPELFGAYKEGESVYVDFTPAD